MITDGDRLRASFHVVIGDPRFVTAVQYGTTPPTAPLIGGALDGYFDFDFARGRAALSVADSWFRVERNLPLRRHEGMNAALKGSCLVGMGIFVVFSGQPAHAAEGPLLVVVEAPPALDADAAEIRRAIGIELRSQTIAPMQRGAEPPGRALIVAFDRDRIAMSLRTNDATPIVRDIPAPTDRAARLRAIAWLAATSPAIRSRRSSRNAAHRHDVAGDDSAATTVSAGDRAASACRGHAPATSRQDRCSDVLRDLDDRAETVTTTGRSRRRISGSIGAADGPTTNFAGLCAQHGAGSSARAGVSRASGPPGVWNVQRRSEANGFLSRRGARREPTGASSLPSSSAPSAFVGSARRHGRWTFEPTVGAGLELASRLRVRHSRRP